MVIAVYRSSLTLEGSGTTSDVSGHADRKGARRSRKSARFVTAPVGMTQCCNGIITVGADLVPDSFQEIPYGTTAWRYAYGRRQVAESFNAAVKTHHGGLGTRGSIRLMGTRQIGFMAAFAIAAANVKLIEAFNVARAGVQKIKSKIRRSRRSVPTASSLGVPPPPAPQPPP